MAVRQLTFIPTGLESLMFERAYSKDSELGDKDFINFTATRPTVVKEALRLSNQLIMPNWKRTIDKKDKDTEFSYNYPDMSKRVTVQLTSDEYSKLDNFAYKRNISLTEATLLLVRNYTALLYEDPTLLSKSELGSRLRTRKPDDRMAVSIKLDPELYDWFTIQAVKKGMTTGGFIRQTLNRIYAKNTGIDFHDPRDKEE